MGNIRELDRKLRRKYAKAKRRFELGIWGHDLKKVFGVHLTTWSEAKYERGKNIGRSKNTWAAVKYDNRQLRMKLRKTGISYEDCYCAELSPGKGLVHLHGLIRVEKSIKAYQLHEIISKAWGEIHDSPVVWVNEVYNMKGVMAYDLKHALKNYINDGFGLHMLSSKGWLPAGWREVTKILFRWYDENKYPDWVKDAEGIDYFIENNGYEKVWMAREIMDNYLWRWCNGETVKLEFDGGITIIQGNSIYERNN